MYGRSFREIKGSYSKKANDSISDTLSAVKAIRSMEREIYAADFNEHYDYTNLRVNKRKDIAINEIKIIKEHLKDICDESIIEGDFVKSNMLIMCGGYNDRIDQLNQTTLSAAIWILDQLSLQGKLEESYQFLPEVTPELTSNVVVPFVQHPMYDYQLILSMVYLIRQRNTSKNLPYRETGSLQWDPGKADEDETSQNNRKAFDSVIKLLDPKAVKNAADKYEADVWEFYRLSFQVFALIEERIEKLEKELENIQDKAAANAIKLWEKKGPFASPLVTGNGQIDLSSPGEDSFRIKLLNMELDRLDRFTMTEISLVNDREKTIKKLSTVLPEELKTALIHFHVDDPFESAFALLYLLDSGSNIPWFYYGSISVAYTMCDQFPYDTKVVTLGEPVLLKEWNSALYKHTYSGYRWPELGDASGEPVQRSYANNLSQLLYANSYSLFPRVVPEIKTLSLFLDSLGELTPEERDLYSLLLYSLHAENLRAKSQDLYRLDQMNEIGLTEVNDTNSDESAVQSDDLVQEELERLRSKNNSLLALLKENIEDRRRLRKKVDQLSLTAEQQKKELSDLREKVFLIDQEESSEEPEVKIQYPYRTKGKILSFGGQAAWINEMKKRLPDVIFIPPETVPNTDLIRGTDEVWIQTNCISHSSYYRIMGVLKEMDKQVRYFIYSGVGKCSEQIVNDSKNRN